MKTRNLLLSAFVAVAAFSSCSSEDEGMVPSIQDDALVQNLQRFGTKSSTVDVSIGARGGLALTRGVNVNGNEWDFMPDYPTADEIAGVMAYIATNPGGVQWPGYIYYYVQQVGGAHHQYSYVDMNGAPHSGIDGTSSLETLRIQEQSGNWQHVYNFNCGKCENPATHNCVLMTVGFKAARTLNEYSSSEVDNWRLFYWQGNYYLGFDFSMVKGDGKIDADGIYDDWVVKIVPAKGEKPKNPGGDPDPKGDPDPDPTPDPTPGGDPSGNITPGHNVPNVEVDIHHQKHTDWNELKVSVHLRDTADVRVFIPVDLDLQAVADDFDIRTGADYNALKGGFTELIPVKYQIAGDEFTVNVQVNHQKNGIEILIEGAECAQALKHARGIYGDGITFEIHSYLNPDVEASTIWNDILKQVQIPETSFTRWPGNGSCVTYTYGQIHSAYYESELIPFQKSPVK